MARDVATGESFRSFLLEDTDVLCDVLCALLIELMLSDIFLNLTFSFLLFINSCSNVAKEECTCSNSCVTADFCNATKRRCCAVVRLKKSSQKTKKSSLKNKVWKKEKKK